jgi:charged multivesicular body protein 1
MKDGMVRPTSLSTPDNRIKSLMQHWNICSTYDCTLELFVGLPQGAAHAIPIAKNKEKVGGDDLTRYLTKLNACRSRDFSWSDDIIDSLTVAPP